MDSVGDGKRASWANGGGISKATPPRGFCVVILLALLAFASDFPCQAVLSGDDSQPGRVTKELSFEVRAVWGGGAVRAFAGSITINHGSIELIRNLSLQDDSVGTVRRKNSTSVTIEPHSPSTFGGADLLLKGGPDSELVFEWQDTTGTPGTEPQKIKLSQLLHESWLVPIDQRGSRLAVERLARDRVRTSVNRGQSIFTPGDHCNLTIEGYRCDAVAGEYRLNVRLVELANGKLVQSYQLDVEVDEYGNFPPKSINEIGLPDRSGVYSFEISLQKRRRINSLIGAMSIVDRKLEVVVVESSAPNPASNNWKELAQIYPAGASWWDSLGKFRIPTVKSFTPLVAHLNKPLSSGEHGRRIVGNAECMVLTKGAWQAFPLPVQTIGMPHRAVIKVPTDQAQKLVFSIQESSSSGDMAGLRLDSGLTVHQHQTTEPWLLHELLFWPRSTQPYLLIFNADAAREATIAEVSLEASDAELSSIVDPVHPSKPNRLAAIYYDKPLMAENFGAQRRLDGKGHRELDSWQTLYEAGTRLAAYTSWSGYNSAILTVATQGSAIYPSTHLSPSPKFDSGLFLSDGSNPAIKDFVELICREFDRRGLKLILALDLEGELPDLAQSKSDSELNGTLYQVDLEGNHYSTSTKTERSKATRYNPLDSRVQSALTRIVRELLARYSQHPCFAGIQINLSDRSPFNFIGDRWGHDSVSLARFQRNVNATLPSDATSRQQLLTGPLRYSYLSDRAGELTKFHGLLGKEIAKARAGAKLYINPAKLLSATPSPENFADVESTSVTGSAILLGCGLDCAGLNKEPHVCLLRPAIESPFRAPVSQSWSYQISADSGLDAMFAGPNAGAIVQHFPTGFRLADFDKANPFGSGRSRTWLFPHGTDGGDAARKALVSRVFHHDAQVLATGGWMSLMGQESSLRPLFKVLSQLPPVVMTEYTGTRLSTTMRIRSAVHEGNTFFQLVNNASWSESVSMEIQCKSAARIETLNGLDTPSTSLQADDLFQYSVELPPYSLVGVRIDCDDVKISKVTTVQEASLVPKLERRINELQGYIARAGELNEQQTLGLSGGDFESWGADGRPMGWTVSTNPSTSVSEERELPRSGSSCVRISNKGNGATTAWIQSDRIAIPSSGRMALEVWVRSAPGLAQPTVRLSLIGTHRDGKRFRRWHEFAPSPKGGTQFPIDWGRRPLVLLVPDVPNEDLTDLHVAIDLIGQGQLWVDDVRVYGMYLHPDEKVHLLGQIFLAKEEMRKGSYALVEQLLESFWACYLSTYMSDGRNQAVASDRQPTREAKRNVVVPQPWRSSSTRWNQWQDSLRQRWQK